MPTQRSATRRQPEEVADSWSDEDDADDPVSSANALNEDGEVQVSNDASSEISTPESEASEDEEDEEEEDEEEEDDDDDDDDEDDSSDHYTLSVLKEYQGLLSRRVDLVGDYAGNELFLIDGDSLLLRAFSDQRLDFDHGFQMLHATYNVEQLLHQLLKRKCNFHVVFFSDNKALCLPPTAKSENRSKYLLARAAILSHLKANLPAAHLNVQVEEFSAYTSAEFKSYLELHSPYFIMAHDGALSSRKGRHLTSDASQGVLNTDRAALREFILFFIERGFNVALINGLEWRDTKVMAMVLERRRHLRASTKARGTLVRSDLRDVADGTRSNLDEIKTFAPHFTKRQILAVLTIINLLKARPATPSEGDLIQLSLVLLVHQATLTQISLSARRLPQVPETSAAIAFVREIAVEAESILPLLDGSETCDVADFFDGRLFSQCRHHPTLGPQSKAIFDDTAGAVKRLSGVDLRSIATLSSLGSSKPNGVNSVAGEHGSMAVMPFSNAVFDTHLESIHLEVDEYAEGYRRPGSQRIFREITHWHNAKKPLIQRGPATAASEKQAFWAAKRNQMFMAEMQKYAASLTNAVGRSLEPETVIVGAPKQKALLQSSAQDNSDASRTDGSVSASNSKAQPKKGGTGKNAAQNAKKQAMLDQIAAEKAKKGEVADVKILKSWKAVCDGFEADRDARSRYRKAKEDLAALPSSSKVVIEAESQLYMLNCLVFEWIAACQKKEKSQRIEMTGLIWNTCRNIVQTNGLTKEIVSHVDLTATTLGLPPVSSQITQTLPSRKLAFNFALPAKADDLSINLHPIDFQLRYCGPYLERTFDSAHDSRVEFRPDGWQRQVLDAIDGNHSVFAVAPTSAGKTFISFYAMRKVLEADDDGVLVYVAPTKALVNQIAAEIQARYSKKFKYGGKSVWAIHTRDYRINSPTGCQVLVTVPHVLQIMLLAPTNANSWSSKVKRIIFDEVHSIGQAEDGVVWEQLLLLAPCPIIALSATVGNPTEFSDWLATTQRAIGVELVTVQHPHRYSDLRKYYYVPPKRFSFHGLPDVKSFGTLGLEGAKGFNHIHPVAALVDRSRGIPEDIVLEPRDCFELYSALAKHATDRHPVPRELHPRTALPEVSKKVDIIDWERNLKEVLQDWIADASSPYDKVVHELELSFRDEEREPLQMSRSGHNTPAQESTAFPDELCKWSLAMLCKLHEEDALPAIMFNYDRGENELIFQSILEQLEKTEKRQAKSGAKWTKKLENFEEWKKVQAKKAPVKKAKKGGNSEKDDEKVSKLDQEREAGTADADAWASFNPDAPLAEYSFADYSKVLGSEIDIYERQLKRRGVSPSLISGLRRGLGVHHAGMNRKYRQIVEMLFRKGFLRVVIATGTLALGINMPCKTVVFSGDSVFLTALNYRQCAGRAGRRGFDLLGNVVFQDIQREKVCRLISSRLPDLNGHFPITTTLVLRLFTLLHESKNSKYAISAINALLSQPRLYMGGPSFKDQTMHHLRFSIEYLRRQCMLASNGAPLNFAGLVSHLYFTENSSFAFHALLKEGYFHELCAGIHQNEKDTLETLMLVMAHLFNRIPCRQADEEYKRSIVKPSSSIVFLPPMPEAAAKILREHNQQTLDIYRTYVETFVDQHIDYADCKLPLTEMEIGATGGTGSITIPSLPETKTRSPFVALSGLDDVFESVSDLCQTVRDGVFLEEAVIPYVGIYPEETGEPLNAWLLDFFKHGDVHTLERANKIRRSDIWFLLNDFSLVLATIVTSLMGFMKLKEGTDMSMLDIMGSLDAREEAEDDDAATMEVQSDTTGTSVADSAVALPERPRTVKTKKAKDTESWEDIADEEDKFSKAMNDRAANDVDGEDEMDSAAWEGAAGDQGLRTVLKAFTKLHAEFNVKFRAMWA